VSETISHEVVTNLNTLENVMLLKMMFIMSFCGLLILMVSSLFGVPISSTHTIVSSLIGVALGASSSININSDKINQIWVSWFAAPLISTSLSLLFLVLMA
jgi:phosphate/sulfate permease